jgi:hypothetical protein
VLDHAASRRNKRNPAPAKPSITKAGVQDDTGTATGANTVTAKVNSPYAGYLITCPTITVTIDALTRLVIEETVAKPQQGQVLLFVPAE